MNYPIVNFIKVVILLMTLSFLIIIIITHVNANMKILHIGGIFPITGNTGWQGGQACLPAAMLALNDVNNREDILPGYTLSLFWNDSKCEPGLGVTALYDLLYNLPIKQILLVGCSTVSTTVAEAAKMWNLIVLSYGASSPALSDRGRFTTFFRTHPSANVHNPTRIKLFQKFGWSRIAILLEAEETVEDLELRCKEAGVEILTRQSFLTDPSDALRNLRRQDARIIVGLFYVVAARRVMCEAYKLGLYGKAHVWFLIGWYEDNWYKMYLNEEDLNCSEEDMKIAIDGHITTEALMWNRGNQITISGMTSDDFKKRLDEVLINKGFNLSNNEYPEGYQEAPLAYDAIWASALALNQTVHKLQNYNETIEHFTYNNKHIANVIYESMNSLRFLGISGTVAFSSKGDRIAWTQVEQMINGTYYKLGYYDTHTDFLMWLDKEQWIGSKLPQDRTIIRPILKTISLNLFVSISIVSLVGILWALILLFFNCYYQKRRLIYNSQPVCNNLILLGIILILISVCLLGLDGKIIQLSDLHVICQIRVWFMCLGFSFAYGAMFSKIWCLHTIVTHAKMNNNEVKINATRNKYMHSILMVTFFLLVDLIILIAWQIIDPLKRTVEMFALETQENIEDVQFIPELEHCESVNNTVWLGIIFTYKGILLIFGLFLTYETRSVKIKTINDSNYVGMAIYNIFVLCLITASVSLVIASQPDASYAFVSVATIFCCFLSMALIFIPKIIGIIQNPQKCKEPRSYSSSILSNAIKEKYEKLLRENKELQLKIKQIDLEIEYMKTRIGNKECQEEKSIKSTLHEKRKINRDNNNHHDMNVSQNSSVSDILCMPFLNNHDTNSSSQHQTKQPFANIYSFLQDFDLTESYI